MVSFINLTLSKSHTKNHFLKTIEHFIKVKVDGSTSKARWIYNRLPQGAVLRPIIFISTRDKFDRRLNFSAQIKNSKVTDRLNMKKILAYEPSWRLPEKKHIKLYKSLVRSIIEYLTVY